ncbi:MAG: molybdenum cofactor biosynthesis protein B [Methanobacteriota archaeon]
MDSSHVQEISVSAGVITISTSRSGKEDKSGSIIKNLLKESNISVGYSAIIPDLIPIIRSHLILALETCNCLILTGGTGITHDDCTIEAVSPLFDKTLDGFGELFRMKSLAEVGTRVILSRAAAGIIGQKVVFCIPGSPNAATLATKEIIIPELMHILTHAQK